MRSDYGPVASLGDRGVAYAGKPALRDRRPRAGAVILMVLTLVVVIVLSVTVSPLVAAPIFVVGFILAAATWPVVAFVFVLGASAFPWDVANGPVHMAAAEIAIVLTLLAFWSTSKVRRVRNPLWIPMVLYFTVCVVSIGANGMLDGTTASMVQMIVYMVVTVYVFSAGVTDPRQVFPGLYALIAGCLVLVGMLAIARDNYAFGIHKNTLGDSISMGVIVATGLWIAETDKKRRRRIVVTMLVLIGGLVFTLSRGAWMGTVGGIMVMLSLRGEWRKSLKLSAVAVPIVAGVWLLLPAQAKEYATAISTESHNTQTRIYSLEYCWQLFQQSPVLGVGPGLRKTYDSTNLIMMVLSETGILGILTFGSIFVVFAWIARKAAKKLDSHDPALVLLTIGAALMTGKFIHGMVEHYWVRGMLPVWAGAGLVIYAYDRTRRRA